MRGIAVKGKDYAMKKNLSRLMVCPRSSTQSLAWICGISETMRLLSPIAGAFKCKKEIPDTDRDNNKCYCQDDKWQLSTKVLKEKVTLT